MSDARHNRLLRILSAGLRALAGALLILAAVGVSAALFFTKPSIEQTPIHEVVRRVRAIEAAEVPLAPVWTGYGVARSMDVATVTPEVAGRVASRPAHIEDGVHVVRGEVLLRLDDADFAARLEGAQQNAAAVEAQIAGLAIDQRRLGEQVASADAELDLWMRDLDRLRTAVSQGAANQTEVDRLMQSVVRLQGQRAALAQQHEVIPSRRAQLEADLSAIHQQETLARRDLDRARIVAPIEGSLAFISAREGDYVGSTAPVARVIGLSRIEVPLRIAASAASQLAAGDEAVVRAVGPDATRWVARIARISPEADPQTRAVTIYLELDQPEDGPIPRLMPGRFVVAELSGATPRPRLVVPRRAVVDDRVFIAEPTAGGENQPPARARPVDVRVAFYVERSLPAVDPDESEWAVIEGDVSPGDVVITTNLEELIDGTPVDPRTPEPGERRRGAPAGGGGS